MKYIKPLLEGEKGNGVPTKVTAKEIEKICGNLDLEFIEVKMNPGGFNLTIRNPFRDAPKNIQNIKIFLQTIEDFEKNLIKSDNELRFYYKIGNEIIILGRTSDMVTGG